MKKALITIVIGDAARQMALISHPTFKTYANRIGADFAVISDCKLSAIPHFEKFRLREWLQTYDRVIYIDNDTIIRRDCPDLAEVVPEDRIGIYDESLLATTSEKSDHLAVMRKAFALYDIPFIEGGFYNTGVMILSKMHEGIFVMPERPMVMEYMEQPYLNIRIRQLKADVVDIGFRFNRMQYVTHAVGESRLRSYIVHYAGMPGAAPIMASDVASWSTV